METRISPAMSKFFYERKSTSRISAVGMRKMKQNQIIIRRANGDTISLEGTGTKRTYQQDPATAGPSQKRGRGRPPKFSTVKIFDNESVTSSAVGKETSTTDPDIDSVDPDVAGPPKKRGRGRPPKFRDASILESESECEFASSSESEILDKNEEDNDDDADSDDEEAYSEEDNAEELSENNASDNASAKSIPIINIERPRERDRESARRSPTMQYGCYRRDLFEREVEIDQESNNSKSSESSEEEPESRPLLRLHRNVSRENSSLSPPRGGRVSTTVNDSIGDPRTPFIEDAAAEAAFRFLIEPIEPTEFFSDYFEKKPLIIRRKNSNHYQGLFSTKDFEKILDENDLSFGVDVDAVKCVNGFKYTTSDKQDQVFSGLIWRLYHDGSSIRMRDPIAYHKGLRKMCTLLQDYFSTTVGLNVYLTPPGSQGFAPHYDDIDAFVMQIEGKKTWRLYEQQGNQHELARFSSPDFAERDLGVPTMAVRLLPGDILYMPRGCIHQARTDPDEFSLHLTVSMNQLNTWGDFIREGIIEAIDTAMQNDVRFRRALPRDYFTYMGDIRTDGSVNENDQDLERRRDFKETALNLSKKAMEHFDCDGTAHKKMLKFMSTALRPCLNRDEKLRSIHGDGGRWRNGRVVPDSITENTKIRFTRKRAVRLEKDNISYQLVHTFSNSYHQDPALCFVDVEAEHVDGINFLFRSYPRYVKVADLPVNPQETRLKLVQSLYDMGIVMTEKVLPART